MKRMILDVKDDYSVEYSMLLVKRRTIPVNWYYWQIIYYYLLTFVVY